jgi:hypothetical protein
VSCVCLSFCLLSIRTSSQTLEAGFKIHLKVEELLIAIFTYTEDKHPLLVASVVSKTLIFIEVLIRLRLFCVSPIFILIRYCHYWEGSVTYKYVSLGLDTGFNRHLAYTAYKTYDHNSQLRYRQFTQLQYIALSLLHEVCLHFSQSIVHYITKSSR